jgi:hypothetical protein
MMLVIWKFILISLTCFHSFIIGVGVAVIGLELNGTHQLLVYADDVNLLDDSIDAIRENAETILEASMDVGLDINAEKAKYMIMSHHQNSGQK